MELTDNLLSLTQNFTAPDIVQRFSRAIQEPAEKTKAGLKSIIPTLLMGIVKKGSTSKGAETLVNMVKTQDFETANLDENKLRQGDDVVNNIFGGELPTVVDRLGQTTGLNSASITKVLGLAAPMVMGAIGSKVKTDDLGASGLMNFLNKQKVALAGFIPAGIPGLSGISTGATKYKNMLSEKKSWGKIALLLLIAFAAIVWLTGRRMTRNIVTPPTSRAVPSSVSQPVAGQAADIVNPSPALSELSSFLKNATENDIPKRFRFEFLNFETATSTLAPGAENELSTIVSTLNEHPAVKVRLEGFTDNTGIASENQSLSYRRAVSVKEALVGLGVNPDRIDTVGLGSAEPIASNETAEGRATNRRIELVVSGLE